MSEKTKSYIEELNTGVKQLFTSKKWKDYLSFLSRFHSYSVNNTLAIFLQRHNSQLIESYTDWNSHKHIVAHG